MFTSHFLIHLYNAFSPLTTHSNHFKFLTSALLCSSPAHCLSPTVNSPTSTKSFWIFQRVVLTSMNAFILCSSLPDLCFFDPVLEERGRSSDHPHPQRTAQSPWCSCRWLGENSRASQTDGEELSCQQHLQGQERQSAFALAQSPGSQPQPVEVLSVCPGRELGGQVSQLHPGVDTAAKC